MSHIALSLAKAAGWFSRALGRGGGTTLPGMILLKLRPHTLHEMAQEFEEIIVISATNGKTTTARMVSHATHESGIPFVANTSGANLPSGIATALLQRKPDEKYGIFEVDEAALPELIPQLEPTVLVLMNLFRDQLDRYGELETTIQKWKEMIESLPETTKLIINADDPALAYLGSLHQNVQFFGLELTDYGSETISHAADSLHCQKCDSPLNFQQVTIGHLGHWECQNCGFHRPHPSFTGDKINLKGLDGSEFIAASKTDSLEIRLPLAGIHNVYNALAAYSTCSTIGISATKIQRGLWTVSAAFGRNEIINFDGVELMIMLAKNPAGANQNLKTLLLEEENIHLAILLNDRTADGKDVSWIWDVDYEMIIDRIASLTISGDRAYDLALRFHYAGFPATSMHVAPSIQELLNHLKSSINIGGRAIVLPTYTSMLDLRSGLNKIGATHSFWEEK
jgi:UDP-N-acetylmuramyl tripeptide synthase